MICSHCAKMGIKAEDLTQVYNEDKVCQDCLDEHYFQCCGCDEFFPVDDRHDDYNMDGFCDSCFYDTYFHCTNCGDVCDRNNGFASENGDMYCESCYEDGYCDTDEDNSSSRSTNENTKKFQNEQKGKTIESKRTFGVELEVLGRSSEVEGSIDGAFGLVEDGSIQKDDNYNGGFELVSPVLKGKAGEDAMIEACKILNKNDIGLNQSCGMHVHLGAGDFIPLQEKDYHLTSFNSKDYENEDYLKHFIPKRVFTENFKGNLKEFIERFYKSNYFVLVHSTTGKKRYNWHYDSVGWTPCPFDEAPPEKKTKFKYKKDDVVIYTKTRQTDVLDKLKNLLLFYIAFEPFLFATQPKSRREGNQYSQSLQRSFSFQDIRSIDKEEEFEKYWYKKTQKREISRVKNNHYHDSRYYSVNFHSLFETKKGKQTLEIRVHAGTKNATKVLNWVYLHQTVLDKISGGVINEYHADKAQSIFLLEEKIDYFFSVLKLKPEVEKYFRKRIRTFTLQIKKGSEDSENE